jgi:O-antigen/teichoic acid export membrane protein
MLNRVGYFKLSLLYSALAALPPVIQLFTQPFIEGVDKLSAADFSRIGMAEQVTTFAFTIILFSMSAAIARFYYDNNESKAEYNKLVSGTFISILFRGAIMLVVALSLRNFIGNLFSQPELKDFSSYGFASVVIAINRSIFLTATALYRNEKRVKAFIIVNISLAIIRAAFQVSGVLLWDMSFLGYVHGTAIGGSLVSIFILYRVFRQSGFVYNREFMKPIYSFAFPLVQYGIISWALFFVDKFFMESNPVKLGIYITVMNFANGLMLIIQGIQAATQPEVFLYMKKGIAKHSHEIRSLGNMLMAQTQVLIALAIIPTIAYFHLFFETEVQQAATYVSIIFIRFIPRSQYFVFSFAIFYEKKTRILFFINTFNLVVAIWLNYLLIPILSIYGAVIAVLVSEIIQMMGVYLYSKKNIPIKWNLTKTLYIPLISLLLIAALEVFKQYFNINIYLSGALASFIILSGLLISYRIELKKLARELL